MTVYYQDYDLAARKVVERVGKRIFMGAPLGIGKSIGFINAMYRLALQDKSIDLTILTALTLARPILHNELEKRLVEPILDRLLKDYEDPLYEKVRQLQQLPENIKILEFYLTPGKYLHNDYVQQNYISSKYTSVAEDTLAHPINVAAYQVAHSKTDPQQYSFGSNTDVVPEILHGLKTMQAQGKEIAIVAEVNANMPFMLGDAVTNSDTFTDIIDTKRYRALFALPREELSKSDYLIGLYSSALIKDDGCLQVGIGKLGNALASALIMRHRKNDVYQDLFKKLEATKKFGEMINGIGGLDPFDKGIYASTEMVSDEYLQLYNAGIVKKKVYDHEGLQRLLNQQKISETVMPGIIDVLLENKIINSSLTSSDFLFLKKFGIFKSDISFENAELILSSGEKIPADLSKEKTKQKIIENCLGDKLKEGKLIHAGFFVGSVDFYRQLHEFPLEVMRQIDMTSVARTNSLLWSFELAKLQRKNARFVNTAMMVNLGGAYISDGLKDFQEVSGVGGQFDFVNMAQSLHDARSIINIHSVKEINHKLTSNIVWNYPNITIPRYLRDIVVTEYGIADCRGKTDAQVIQILLNITDSRFQENLLETAKRYGKVPKDYQIPADFKNNYPKSYQTIVTELQRKGYCQPYPFGSDLTEEEQTIARVLLFLKGCRKAKLIWLLLAALITFKKDQTAKKYLLRMKLDRPKNISEYIYKKLFVYILARQNAE